MKIKDTLFAVIFFSFLLGPILVWGAAKTTINLPSWLIADNLKYLSGNVDENTDDFSITIEEFISKDYQKKVENNLAASIPMKSHALLTNAELQRISIATSNYFFNWDCYPTFYNSDILYSKEYNALYRYPYFSSGKGLEALKKFAKYISNIAHLYPDKDFYIYLVDISRFSPSNPAQSLVGDKWIEVKGVTREMKRVVTSQNVLFLDDETSNKKDYLHFFYSTDHHWNGFGAIRAYRSIIKKMGIEEESSLITGETSFGGLTINGSNSRQGLMELNEAIVEPLFDFSDCKVMQGSKAPVYTSNAYVTNESPLEAEYDFYCLWYGNGSLTLKNEQRSGSVLLLCDSYGYSLRWLLGKSCNKLIQKNDFVDGRYNSLKETKTTLSKRINDANPDKIVFLAAPTDLINITWGYEAYFS